MMSFTSLQFVFGFLPLTFIGFVLANRWGGTKYAINFLALASLVFYGMWGLPLLFVLLSSMIFNFAAGNVIACLGAHPKVARNLMLGAVLTNIFMLGYLKYTNFLIDVANQMIGADIQHLNIMVPLGVSFFTFIQIGYLIDAYNGQLLKHDFGRYIVFTAFFPCVTAGPLVLQREMMEQLGKSSITAWDLRRVTIGLTMFAMGLFKKVVLADSIAPFADGVFNGVQSGGNLDAATAWIGAFCYTLQLYFDFSGYSDMAIGIATVFAIKLPLNFDSPFKATNISDFWRRWHMTMTRFFTTYVFSSLAMHGMRSAMSMRFEAFGRFMLVAALPSVLTFLVAGVWHGSGWNFVIYGLIHGLAIAVYLGWREFSGFQLPAPVAWLLTVVTVVCGLVMFRAADVTSAMTMLAHMWGLASSDPALALLSIDTGTALSMIVLLGAITLLLPNTQQILHHEWPVVDTKPQTAAMDAGLITWRPSFGTALVSASIFAIAITSIGSTSSFLYYKF